MMSRKFTTREKVLLIICAVLLLAIFYYRFVYLETTETVETFNTSKLETDLLVAQTKAMREPAMKSEIEANSTKRLGVIAPYNNLQSEIAELNMILSNADTYSLDFSDPTLEGETVRRNIRISFHVGSYHAMKDILEKLRSSQYRCLLGDVFVSTASTESTGITRSTDLNVNVNVTFFETTVNATSLAGLPQEEAAEEAEKYEEEDLG